MIEKFKNLDPKEKKKYVMYIAVITLAACLAVGSLVSIFTGGNGNTADLGGEEIVLPDEKEEQPEIAEPEIVEPEAEKPAEPKPQDPEKVVEPEIAEPEIEEPTPELEETEPEIEVPQKTEEHAGNANKPGITITTPEDLEAGDVLE